MHEPVPYLDLKAQMQPLRAELDAAIARALDRCSFILGPDVAQFERDFAAFVSARHCVGMNSGTSALHLAMLLAGVGPGDEVITTPFTFAATSWGISYVGAKPVYVDIEESTYNLDPARVTAAITPRTKAILPVHLYGHPCHLEPLLAVAAQHGLPLIEDAAQAHGARYRGQTVGTFGQSSIFSFYPGKNLGAYGEGGALVTNDDALAARARSLRDHGCTQRYHHDEVGFNYRMEGLTGAILGVKLPHLARWTAARRRHAQRYSELLAGLPVVLPVEANYAESAWHLYVLRTPQREALKAHLEQHQIGCATHYPHAAAPAEVLRIPGLSRGRLPRGGARRARGARPADVPRADRGSAGSSGGGGASVLPPVT
jgi:dTDP-4-amino-4,6-dideoxygalactose transaminase